MKVTVIDAQGGGMGKQVVSTVRKAYPEIEIIAIGTNSIAASVMLKAGANRAAAGENAVVVASRSADVIIGPIGIVIADSLLGEVTPKMAVSVAQSTAKKLFIPFNHCDNYIVGINDLSMKTLIKSLLDELDKIIRGDKTCL